ncbi:PMS1 protein homolog 1-like isoform X2 [Pomacea canaliculata]|uniref:PMS1 protein homolog 1-like isoform X2 n=1 Tax=Pomacea canaliculata TaxID=400727 RepID=UPI000D73DC3F|nr:PMS1 protein homolog 1-like isoform X2 [Pomacea canaliculata]
MVSAVRLWVRADVFQAAKLRLTGSAGILASLCAVADVVVTTKAVEDDVSFAYTINSEGDITSKSPSYLGQGTTVCAKNLFKNLPVRKQYHNIAKKKKDELKRVEDLLIAYGLVRPDVRISLRHNKELLWQKVILPDTASTLQSVLGKSAMGQMEWKIDKQEDPQMEIKICLPKPGSDVSLVSRSSPDRSFLFVNGRPVQVKEIDKLIRQYYSNCHACDITRHPVYYVSITLPPSAVDVNLEPNKTTVMTTNMTLLHDRLEGILLYIYGPLDQAPSWRYRNADDKENKTGALQSDGESHKLVVQYEKHSMNGSEQPGMHSDSKADRDKTCSGVSAPHTPFLQDSTHLGSESSVIDKLVNDLVVHICTEKSVHDIEHLPENKNQRNHDLTAKPEFEKCSRKTLLQLDHRINQGAQENDVNDSVDLAKDVVDNLMRTCTSNVSSNREDSDLTAAIGSRSDVQKHESKDGSGCQPDSSRNIEDSAIDVGNVHQRRIEASATKREDRQESIKAMPDGDCSYHSSSSAWSCGTSLISKDGSLIQPVKLLAPSPSHFPGKRSLSPAHDLHIQKTSAPPEKRQAAASSGRRLYPAQSTLYDMINNVAVKRPLLARDYFFKEKRSEVVQSNPELGFEEVTKMLFEMWENLAEDERKSFNDKCHQDAERYKQEVEAAKTVETNIKSSSKSKPMSVRDMVAASSTQPSSESKLKTRDTQHVLPFSMASLKLCIAAPVPRRKLPACQVLAQLPSCKAWLCCRGKELCILNCYRLSESVLFHKLINEHHLPKHHCQTLCLQPSNFGKLWPVLERIADNISTNTSYFQLSDTRIVANGFDIKCWKDGNSKLCGELVGLCGDIPTYGLPDLLEVLELINRNTKCSLAEARPLKVINHLKGEAVRMARNQMQEKSLQDVQELLDQASHLPLDQDACLHNRPFYHRLLLDYKFAVHSHETLPIDSSNHSNTSQPASDYSSSLPSSEIADTVICISDLMDFE